MKETRQQIVENTRKKVAAQYKAKILDLEEQIRALRVTNSSYWKERCEFKEKCNGLTEQIENMKDWIERLQDYVNLPPDERERALATYRQKQANAEAEARLFGSPIFKIYEEMLSNLI